MALTCKTLIFKAPPVFSLGAKAPSVPQEEEPENPDLPTGTDNTEIEDDQQAYKLATQITGMILAPIPSTMYVSASTNGKPSWTTFDADITSLVQNHGTDKIYDFAFTKNIGADSAYVRNIILHIVTDNGTIQVPFLYSQISHFESCDIYIHPENSGGNQVHTYEFVPLIEANIVSAVFTFELADDWLCADCCGDESSGVGIEVVVGVQNTSPSP